MKKTLFALIVLFFMVGCVDSVPRDELTIDNETISSNGLIEPIQEDSTLSFSFVPYDGAGEYKVTFILHGEPIEGGVFYTYDYQCTVTKQDGIVQTFEVESMESMESMRHIYLIDMDFDGCTDMGFPWSQGTANVNFGFHRFDMANNRFDETPFFNVLSVGIVTYPETRQIITTTRGSAVSYSRAMYRYADGEYTLERSEEVEVLDYEPLKYSLSIYDDDRVIYSAILTEDEYYGDYAVRDSYLLYGE